MYGYQVRETDIAINIAKIWRKTRGVKRKEDNFIHNFCKVVTHEELHRQIFNIFIDQFYEKEEEIVDVLSGTSNMRVKK